MQKEVIDALSTDKGFTVTKFVRKYDNYDIEVTRQGRIAFLPKKDGEQIPSDLTKLPMPPRAFWESLADLLYLMDHELTQSRKDLAVLKMENAHLTGMVGGKPVAETVRKVYINAGNKKKAFLAGLVAGRKERNG